MVAKCKNSFRHALPVTASSLLRKIKPSFRSPLGRAMFDQHVFHLVSAETRDGVRHVARCVKDDEAGGRSDLDVKAKLDLTSWVKLFMTTQKNKTYFEFVFEQLLRPLIAVPVQFDEIETVLVMRSKLFERSLKSLE